MKKIFIILVLLNLYCFSIDLEKIKVEKEELKVKKEKLKSEQLTVKAKEEKRKKEQKKAQMKDKGKCRENCKKQVYEPCKDSMENDNDASAQARCRNEYDACVEKCPDVFV